jgi:16S rRNA (cytosine1402-N4)-methyltransferase
MTEQAHIPVLLDEALAALTVVEGGSYIDCNFGRGGHSAKIRQIAGATGSLIAFDKDPAAVAVAQEQFKVGGKAEIVHRSFAELGDELEGRGLNGEIDGILFDLGVSSPQLDEAERGFSFMKDGPLDMRMNPEEGESAAEWLHRAPEKEIADVLYKFGDERYRGRVARHIVEARSQVRLTSTAQLAKIIDTAVPTKERNKHTATRSFQAIRIFINRELQDLDEALSQAVDALKPGGRLVVISFHSAEDRIVKRFMRDASRSQAAGFGTIEFQPARLRLVGKPVHPSEEEVARNPRSRSSVMRIAERLAADGSQS